MSHVQQHWDVRAALNFILGGAGAGLMVSAAFLHAPSPYVIAAALALIAAGLFAVWLKLGRKLRAANVLFNPFTSWMAREAFVALLLFPLALGSLLTSRYLWAAALAALVFLWCQARILRAARGISAWRAPEVVPLVMSTGLAEGAGLCLFFTQEPFLVSFFALVLILRALAWAHYRAVVKTATLEAAGKGLLQVGTVSALLLLLLVPYVEEAAFLAAAAAIATGWRLKLALVTRAAFHQGFSLPRLPVRGTH
jgi:phenylacetyl-CoA:acceptor oxidoreductase 26-kDa subunit